ncbi:MAG: Ger(x)C family spore germination protein [Clostridiaceae bacterium]|nr:Ger(x)C family spore germination protein [Clostridiaceae bacterium]
MKKKIMCILLLVIFLSTGCFSYSDIDKVMFVTAIVVDVDPNNEVLLYLESFMPFRSASKDSAKGERIVFKGTGKTVYEVMKDLNLSSSYQFNYTQNRVIIFTQKATEFGIENYIDTFQRQQELLIRPYVLVYKGDPNKLLQMQLKEEEYIGIFLNRLIENQKNSSRTVQVNLNKFLARRTLGSKTNVVTLVDMSKDELEPKLEANGGSILKNDKYVGDIKKQDGEKYNFLMDNVKEGTLEPANPVVSEKFITLNILSNKTSTFMEYDGKKIHLKKVIHTKVAIADIQKGLILNKDNLSKLKSNSEENIKKLCTDFFNDFKKQKLDIFEVEEEFNRRYPKEKINNIMDVTELDIQVNVAIDDSIKMTDFR